MLRTLVVVIALVLPAHLALAQPITSRLSSKFGCSPGGCEPMAANVWSVIDLSAQTYARCDAKGCAKYDAVMSRSGVYVVIDLPGRGMIVKLASDLSAFLEVATIMTQ